ncbi:MAG: helix-turn-helix domain-containing protein [Alphaproteobacteria bacterium]|nr:helix-turn-helix domain-containing protein [Alphaproteobacteria bacterium]MBU6473083.1 helix-turn-helix domain-containing protein [Alphaproteobacteria bacterium]MDE2013831.1 helix-turn-helix domain-containing protein [Alphaproteobacteria bacterium]MDE2073613.1 helix-turn-helix domain-containing protein [Alphaproteobacteria bacterium]
MLKFSTDGLPSRGRALEYSKALSAYCSTLESDSIIRAEVEEADILHARSESFEVGNLIGAVHDDNSPCHRYSIRQAPSHPGYTLYLITKGTLTLTSDETELQLRPGDMAFFRPKRIAEFRSPEGENSMISFLIPLRLASVLARGREIALDRVFSTSSGIGACVGSLMETVAARNKDLTLGDSATLQTVLAEAMIQLGTSLRDAPERDSLRGEMLCKLKALAAASLDDPELTPATVAKRAGISVRTLHRSFRASGETFWSWLRDERLDRCHMELADPSFRRRRITEVAFRWGFNELSTFDRNFRKRFGVSPRAMRSVRPVKNYIGS